MNSANRTLAFVLVAVGSVGIAVAAHRMYQPSAVSAKSDVGTAFFPDFQDPTTATSLGVAAYNSTSNKVDEFRVEKRDGLWRIPSHHNYPADAKDRLARTAASMIGVTRGQLVTDTASGHARLNLLDPLDKAVGGTEGRGSRITLKAGDTVLTDLIIGKKEEGGGDRYYVRRADEDRVYLAQVKPELTTKFTDWIQPNVLDATAATFREIEIARYSVEFDGPKGKIVNGVTSRLDRDSSSDEWKLEGIPAGQKLKTSVVTQMVSALASMKIVGVRPKTPGIAAAFRGDKDAPVTNLDLFDMQNKGYFDTGSGGLRSKEGDFIASTSEGISYVLRFGAIVPGDEVDIEIGDSKQLTEDEAKKALEEKAAGTDPAAAAAKPAEGKDGDQKDAEAKKENRFLFVTAQLDEKLIGAPPVEPVKPEAPPGYQPKAKPADAPTAPAVPGFNIPGGQKPGEKPAPPAEPKKETSALSAPLTSLAGPGPDAQDETKADPPAEAARPAEPKSEEQKPAETKPVEEKPQAPPADGQPAAQPATGEKKPEPPKDPFAVYEAALAKYEQEMDEYKFKKGEYDEKVKKAQDRVKTLNARFAEWYYVIPADVFNTINVKPEELIEPETTPAAGTNPAGTNPLGTAFPPGLIPPAATATPPAEPKADAPKPEPLAAPPATPPSGEPAKTDKPEAPKAEAAPATTEAPKPE